MRQDVINTSTLEKKERRKVDCTGSASTGCADKFPRIEQLGSSKLPVGLPYTAVFVILVTILLVQGEEARQGKAILRSRKATAIQKRCTEELGSAEDAARCLQHIEYWTITLSAGSQKVESHYCRRSSGKERRVDAFAQKVQGIRQGEVCSLKLGAAMVCRLHRKSHFAIAGA